ncbi:DUF998 domain-containing protein [Halococcoides cellulosivorans]|uniref:DUF998 domain-containing protein n=1 Tax=Halococcoides cellulosivorans TaxID=1679096 RepID=A0A2R4X418_9EURY|nr:DUF998 domain-containing protein [Halococcoides cellulosivorans]AWB28542.1 hypothetical protein HARCEL1_13050 [Halococcoides cellulosivorans]
MAQSSWRDALAVETDRPRLAGGALAGAGLVLTTGITVSGALYPDYSIHAQTISALGGHDASGQLVQPAALVFTLALALTGVLLIVAGVTGWPTIDRPVAGGLCLTGLGVLGVGAFPEHLGAPHAISALVAFAGGGATALGAARATRGPIRWLSALLGTWALGALVAFLVFFGDTPLGVGGLERLISIPIQGWAMVFGGWLIGGADNRSSVKTH